MRNFFVVLVLVLIVASILAYVTHPDEMKADLGAVFAPSSATPSPPVTSPTPLTPPPATPQETSATSDALSTTSQDTAAPSEAPPQAAWAPPAVIPAQANWTWKTPQGTYTNVRIVKIEADCVTILDDDGGALVPIASLSPDLQKMLNYDPNAAQAAAAQRASDDAASAQAMSNERNVLDHGIWFDPTMNDYVTAVQLAKDKGKLLLFHFQGSDWSQASNNYIAEVENDDSFRRFSVQHFIYVTVDFPYRYALPDRLKRQSIFLAKKFGVSVVPTLVVSDSAGHELGRITGYKKGTGPAAVIAELQAYAK